MNGRRALLLAGALLLPACTPLYLPPVPAEAARGEIAATRDPFEIIAGELRAEGGELRLELRVAAPAAPGYAAVQWFDPALRERAAQSVWLEARRGETELRVVVAPPPAVEVGPGRWRALVSADGVALRQFSVVVPSD